MGEMADFEMDSMFEQEAYYESEFNGEWADEEGTLYVSDEDYNVLKSDEELEFEVEHLLRML